jgi:uncharacterized protein YjeT (DUF2065 family)
MSLVTFPPPRAATPKPGRKPAAPGQRLRRAGTIVLAIGLLSAGALYWLETRNQQPGIEDLIPGYSRNASRQMGIFYGHAGELMWEWRQWFARPENQACLVAGLAIVIAAICYRVAWLDDEKARDTP